MKILWILLVLICVLFSCTPYIETPRYSSEDHLSPFSPSSTIQFNLEHEGEVLVLLYNMEEELLDTLVNDVFKKGTHQIYFNATGLPSGVYTYRYISGDTSYVKKMTLIK